MTTIGKRLQTAMQQDHWEAHQENYTASFLADTSEQQAFGEQTLPPLLDGERMSLSLLRKRVRAGWYQDDLHSEEANHLLFLRWLVRAGLISEWTEEEE